MQNPKTKVLTLGLMLLLPIHFAEAQWNSVPSPSDRVFAFTTGSDGRLFAGSENSGLWVSQDGGGSFATYPTGLPEMNFDVTSFASHNETVWAGMYGGGVARSVDGGANWVSFNDGFQTQSMVVGLQHIGDTVYAAIDFAVGLQASGVYKSPVQQANWQRTGTGFPETLSGVTSFTVTNSGGMFVGAALAGTKGNVQVSLDGGLTWLNRAIPNVADVYALETDGIFVYTGTSDGVYASDDNGEHWARVGTQLQGRFIDEILFFDGMLFAAIDQIGVAFSTDAGASWDIITGNLPIENDYVSALFVYQDRLFAGLSAPNRVWSVPLLAVSIEEDELVPQSIQLAQNYPNPFNPATTILFSLSKMEYVTMKVYDTLGREVTTLLNHERKEPGVHTILFEAKNLSSGIYFCYFSVNGFTQVRKMLLLD